MAARARFTVLALAGVATLVLTGCSGTGADPAPEGSGSMADFRCADVDLADAPDEPTPLRLGGATGIDTYSAWMMMTVSPEEFRPNAGVWYTLENQAFPDPAQRVSALQAGQIDGMVSSMPQMLTLKDAGIDAKVVAPLALSTVDSEADARFVVATDSDIKGFDDLAGKNVGVLGFGTAMELLTRMSIESAGGDPDDTTFVVVPPAQVISSIEAGTIDAGTAAPPFVGQALDAGTVRDLGSQGFGLEALEGVDFVEAINLMITDKYLTENPEAVCAYLADYRASLEWLRDDLDEARQTFVDEELIALPYDVYSTFPPLEWPEGEAFPSVEYYLALAPYAQKYGFVTDGSEDAVRSLIWSGLGSPPE